MKTLILFLCAITLSAQIPSQYSDLYNSLDSQISAFDGQVRSSRNGARYPTFLAPQLGSASSNLYTSLLGTYHMQSVDTELNALQSIGANAVTIHVDFPILYRPFYKSDSDYQNYVTFYQEVAADVHSRGMKLVVQSATSLPFAGNQASQFTGYYKNLSWSAYMAGRAQNVVNVAQLLSPDYISCLYESDTEARTSGQSQVNTPDGATQLVQGVIDALANARIATNLGAGVGTWTQHFNDFVSGLSALDGLNFIDLHVYPINRTYLTNLLTATVTANVSGKSVGISEAWLYKVRDSELGKYAYGPSVIYGRDPFSFWEPLDAEFWQALYDWASYDHAAFISPFWDNYFAANLDYGTEGQNSPTKVTLDEYTAANNARNAGTVTALGRAIEVDQLGAPDTQAPSTPAQPTAAVGYTSVTLTWSATPDNVGTAGYKVYRNGSLVTTVNALSYYDQKLSKGTVYSYAIQAFDAFGNVSEMSPSLQVTTFGR